MNETARRWVTAAIVLALLLLGTTCGLVTSDLEHRGGGSHSGAP
jgi:hypothetical protein